MPSFFAIAFANYVEMQDDFKQSFAEWLKVTCLLGIVKMMILICIYAAENRNLDVSLSIAYLV